MDELYESGIKLYYLSEFNFIFENGVEMEASKVQRNFANCQSYSDCLDWAKYHKNVSILFPDLFAEFYYASGYILGENFEPLLCRLEDGVVYNDGLRMAMLQGDPLKRRVSEIIDRVVEAGLYNYWISRRMHSITFHYRKTAIFSSHDGYYSFNLYHMQPAFYLLLMGWCLNALCFVFELLCNRLFSKRKLCL